MVTAPLGWPQPHIPHMLEVVEVVEVVELVELGRRCPIQPIYPIQPVYETVNALTLSSLPFNISLKKDPQLGQGS